MTTYARKLFIDKEGRENLKSQLTRHLGQQSESTQSAHKWMKRVEVAGLGVVAAAFIVALYGSFAWPSVNPILIPVAWFAFAVCLSLMAVLLGLHAILIRAYPPVILPGKPQKFVAGSGAVWIGVASLAGGLILAVLWVLFAYSAATFNLALIVPLMNILGVIVSLGIVVSIVIAIYQKVAQPR